MKKKGLFSCAVFEALLAINGDMMRYDPLWMACLQPHKWNHKCTSNWFGVFNQIIVEFFGITKQSRSKGKTPGNTDHILLMEEIRLRER